MRSLYEIDNEIRWLLDNSVDPDTGELIVPEETIEALAIERKAKIENLCLYWKEQRDMADAIRAEEVRLSERRRRLEKNNDKLFEYIQAALNGSDLKTPRVVCGYRRVTSVAVTDADMAINWAESIGREDLLRRKPPELDKAACKAALKCGDVIPGTELRIVRTMSIK